MIILDTYDLGNGNIAQLIESDAELSCGLDVEPRYAIDIMNGIKMMSLIPFQSNPLDAIFILMDLGLIHADYTLGETLQNHPLAPKKYWLP
jgi:hypothetical protein